MRIPRISLPAFPVRLALLAFVVAAAAAIIGWHSHSHTGLFVTTADGETMLLSEWRLGADISPAGTVLESGTVEFQLDNTDDVEHSFVLIRTDRDAGALPSTDAGVDLDAAGVVVGIIQNVEKGSSATVSFELDVGQYVIVCNTQGHYLEGMYYPITVE